MLDERGSTLRAILTHAIEDGLVDRIITVTEAKPYLIQKLCVALVNRAHEENRRTITLADVEAVGLPKEA